MYVCAMLTHIQGDGKGGLKVYKSCCGNCLLSKDSIVSPERRKEIIGGCIKKQTHFICHKASIEGKEILCKTFFDKFGHYSQMVRIAERLNMIDEVEQPVAEKLPSYAANIHRKDKEIVDDFHRIGNEDRS